MKRLFYIVIAALMVLAVASCKKDNDSVGEKCLLVIDGVECSDVVVAREDDISDNCYHFFIYFGEGASNYIEIFVYSDLHFGKKIDLTKGEGDVENSWDVYGYKDNKYMFQTSGDPLAPYVMFKSGTLKITRESSDNFTILLKDGKVQDEGYGDGEEHTIELEYSGPVSKVIIL